GVVGAETSEGLEAARSTGLSSACTSRSVSDQAHRRCSWRATADRANSRPHESAAGGSSWRRVCQVAARRVNVGLGLACVNLPVPMHAEPAGTLLEACPFCGADHDEAA